MEKCAVVLVVKDERSDIATWLSWYHRLGFDACIVFDDDLNDGTWEILQNAAQIQDIRLRRTVGPRTERYQVRQEMSYKFAINHYRLEFDWLAFFDADEFLILMQDVTIHSFLNRFPIADAIGINWCTYGSSRHVLKPEVPCIEAFTWHSHELELSNRHVKSIVRPKLIGENWINVHCYDVPLERYFLANGTSVSWGNVPGIIASDPDWRVAKIMHYQCRSMEHFVERCRKRTDITNHFEFWADCDLNQVQSTVPVEDLQRVRERSELILDSSLWARYGCHSRPLIMDIGMSEGNDFSFYLVKGFRVVGIEADVETYAHLCERFRSQLECGALTIYQCAASGTSGDTVEFFHHKAHQGISGLSNQRSEFSEGTYDSYHVKTINWDSLVEKHGVPYYLKIDIEGQEAEFLRGITNTNALPEYVSVECYTFEAVQILYDLGYRKFKLIDQNPPGGFRLPVLQREGWHVEDITWLHSSGPFGRELPDVEWLNFREFELKWQECKPQFSRNLVRLPRLDAGPP